MTEEPQQPEGETPEETPEDPPNEGAPGEGAPSEGAPGEPGESTPSEAAPDAGEDVPPDPEAPGPEIEGLEELDQAETSEQPAPTETSEQPAPTEDAAPTEERPRPRKEGKQAGAQEPEVIPGAHLEPDLVLEEQRAEGAEGKYDDYDQYADADGEAPGEGGEDGAEPAPVAHTPLELAADARYNATGKRKSAIARVILKPGQGSYTVNGRHLDEYFPRVRLQRMASQPLEAAGYHTRMDVIARIHGGGVSAQANALRHGIARALVEADPALRTELKRRGYLTRDPREKERKKAGLKKARKRPQFSKR
jgi:small subunit ribosomal protein S9